MNLILIAAMLLAQDYPERTGLVNDFADELDTGTKKELHEKLVSLRESGKVRMVVVTVKSLNGQSIEEYAHGLLKKWGIGKKEENDGILFIHAPTERKIRIETGYGMESRLPDVTAKRILSTKVTPLLKAGQWSKAMMAGVDAVTLEVWPPEPKKEAEKQNIRDSTTEKSGGIGVMGWLIMGGLFIVFFLFFLWKSGAFESDLDMSGSSDLLVAGITATAVAAAAMEAARRARESGLPNPSGMEGPQGIDGLEGIQGLQGIAGYGALLGVPGSQGPVAEPRFKALPLFLPPVPPVWPHYEAPKRKRRNDDDDDRSSRRSSSDDSYSSGGSSSSSDSSSDSFGGGDSGGGGASDSY